MAGAEGGYVDNTEVLMVLGTMAVATFITRAFPFVALAGVADHPLIQRFGRLLPPMVMVVLVVYGISGMPLDQMRSVLAVASGVGATVIVHCLFRHVLLSIIVGTGLYMTLIALGG